MDPLSAMLITAGVILLVASWIQLLITSFQEDFSWGLVSLFVPPLSYLYGLFSWEKAGAALGMAVIGLGLIFLAI